MSTDRFGRTGWIGLAPSTPPVLLMFIEFPLFMNLDQAAMAQIATAQIARAQIARAQTEAGPD